MAEKCHSKITSNSTATAPAIKSSAAIKDYLNTVEIRIISQKSSSNYLDKSSDKLEKSSSTNKNVVEASTITSSSKTAATVVTLAKLNSIPDNRTIIHNAVVKQNDISIEEYDDKNDSISMNDDDDENKTRLINDDDENIEDDRENISGNIYLETPILDENNSICKNVHHVHHEYEISNAKPKRISDDFFSSDDGGDDGPSSLVSSSCETSSVTAAIVSNVIQQNDDVDDDDDEDDDDDDDNSNENFVVQSSSGRDYNLEEEEDTNSSLCSSNLVSVSHRLSSNNHDHESSLTLKASLIATTAAHSKNVIVAHPSTNNNSESHSAVTFYDHDVQSMDAIERRDFEHEQRLTGGVIIKASCDNKLNLDFIKSYKESGSNGGGCGNGGNRHSSSDSKISATHKDHSTTPTSSRPVSVRLTKSASKLNLSITLERLEKKNNSLESESNCEILQFSSRNSSDTAEGVGESSGMPSSSSSSLPHHYSRVSKFDMLLNSNSNDSLSSDKSCNTSSNHSIRNFFKRASASTGNNDPFYVVSEDNKISSSSKSINENQQIVEDNESSSDQAVYSEPIPSTSSHTSKCHYPNFCCENTNTKSGTTNSQKETSNTLKNSKEIISKLPISSDRRNTPSTSSSSTTNHFSADKLYQTIENHSSHQQIENHKFEDATIEASSSTHHLPTSSSEQVENEFDDETWADCEEGSDEEICTCSNNDYTTGLNATEDDLPSRDVDLSGYIQMVSISEDIFLQDNFSPDIPSMQRKRKLNDSRMQDSESIFNESANGRKRIAFDCSSTPRSSHQTPAVSSPSTQIERRTPRSLIPTKDNPPPELQDWLLQFQRWSHAERLLAVDRLIEHCEPTQVRHMMKVIEPQFQRDFISLLPKELALQVLSYLEPKDLLRAAQTCRSWRFLCDDNLLWKEKCRQAQIVAEPKTDRPKRGRAGNMPPISSPWKAAYMRQHIIEMNWRSRPIRQPKILKGHDDHVITCLQFSGNRIVSGSDDNTLKVWSAVTGKCLRTLVGHTGGVWSSQMSGNIIISGSTDRTLKVWNMETGQCIHTLLGHTSTVRCMHLHGKKVVSGSRDATLRVWDIEQGTCLHVLVGHLAAVRCVQYDGKLIVSGAYDYMVKVWHPERQECLHTLQGHTNRVYSLQFDGIHVVSGSLDTSIRVWDAETGNCKHTLMGHQSLTSGMELRQNILVSGNADSTVKVWDITTGQCLQTLSGPNKHQSAVTCLQFNSRFVITSSDDGTVKLWDVKTGEFIRNLVALESGGSGGVVWRIRANDTKLICAVGSRNGTEETKLMVLDFDVEGACLKCS